MATSPLKKSIWTWFNWPIAVRSGNFTYQSVMDEGGGVGVARYDHTNQLVEVGNIRGTSTAPIAIDDHNNPAVLRLASGKIFSAFSEHVGKAWGCVTTATDGSVLGAWTQTEVADGSSYYNSYAHLAQTTDDLATLWWFHRPGNSVPMPIAFRLNQADAAGASWQTPVNLINNPSHRPYYRIAVSGLRIDILYGDGNPAEYFTNSVYHVYLLINQAGTQFSVYKSDGTLIDTWAITGGTGIVNSVALPIDVTAGTLIHNGTTSGSSWVWDCQWIGGALHGCFVTFSTGSATYDTHRHWRCSLSSGTWSTETICYGGDSTAGGTVGTLPHWLPTGAPGSNSVYSGGICLDPGNADRVYVSHRTGTSTREIWRWDRVGASNWTRTSSITGADGVINARPFPVVGSSDDVVWFRALTYTNYNAYTTTNPGVLNAQPLARSTKIATPVYTAAYAPAGVKAIYLIYEGTGGNGATVADITGTYNGTIVGTPTWGSDSYGANLSGFLATAYVQINALAASGHFDGGVFPKWLHYLYKHLTATNGQYLSGLGNSASTNQLFSGTLNNTGDNQVGGSYRDNTVAGNQSTFTKTRDTDYHTLTVVVESSTMLRVFSDGQQIGIGTTAMGTTTLNRGAIGALSRTTVGSPASGAVLSYVVAGSGAVPSPIHLHTDSISGQFLGTWAMAGGPAKPVLFHSHYLNQGIR